jgi:hypothetical protein
MADDKTQVTIAKIQWWCARSLGASRVYKPGGSERERPAIDLSLANNRMKQKMQ